jgi:hypothetical protein
MSMPLTRSVSFVRFETGDGAVEHEAQAGVRDSRCDLGRLVGLVLRSDESFGAAIVDDVGEFLGSQTTRAGGVNETRVVAAPNDLEIARMVLHADGDVVAHLQARRAQQVGQPIGRIVELLVGDHLAR